MERSKTSPDGARFVDVIRGTTLGYVPLFEFGIDDEILSLVCREQLGREWLPPAHADADSRRKRWANTTAAYAALGYDTICLAIPLEFPDVQRLAAQTTGGDASNRQWTYSSGPVHDWASYERYPWPSVTDEMISRCAEACEQVPDGMGVLLMPTAGFFGTPRNTLFGFETLSYLMQDAPDLVAAVFDRVGATICAAYAATLGLPNVIGCFQCDDMGHKTATLISPSDLRRYSLPWHARAARQVQGQGKLYLLHSCGCLASIMGDLIWDVRIDGKHSFEDAIQPVAEFSAQYADRIGVLGGVDMDRLCRLSEEELRRYVRAVLGACVPRGRYVLGSGNGIADYVPAANYLAMVEEGRRYRAQA